MKTIQMHGVLAERRCNMMQLGMALHDAIKVKVGILKPKIRNHLGHYLWLGLQPKIHTSESSMQIMFTINTQQPPIKQMYLLLSG